MTRSFRSCAGWLSLGLLLGLAGCGPSQPARVVGETPDSSAPSKAIELLDANHDGALDAKELEKAPGLKAYFDRIHPDHAGALSADQIAARIKDWADSKTARVSATVRITHNGQPLVGAKVSLVPEKFLGGTLQPGEGTTDNQGVAMVSCPYAKDPTIKGVSPGFYRVEVRKDGDNVPAKYNSETTLGMEAAADANLKGTSTLDLKY